MKAEKRQKIMKANNTTIQSPIFIQSYLHSCINTTPLCMHGVIKLHAAYTTVVFIPSPLNVKPCN